MSTGQSDGRDEHRRRCAVATRTDIASAAAEQFRRHGYEKASLRAVAARAGVNAALIIRYFGSKAGLYQAVLQDELGVGGPVPADASRLGDHLVTSFMERPEAQRRAFRRRAVRALVGNDSAELLFHARALIDSVAGQLRGPERALRAEMIGAQILGLELLYDLLRPQPLTEADRLHLVHLLGSAVQTVVDGPPESGADGDARATGPAAVG
ncbi:TetR family transcriptional regulator [Streptomyces sp. NPDC090303]|uniref:TetR/AcrR family transcriptional regulator n=1 Tax=Streptomyces sp. NPDC090303 TaxID=3365960 RepID=UPI00382E8085